MELIKNPRIDLRRIITEFSNRIINILSLSEVNIRIVANIQSSCFTFYLCIAADE